MTEPKSVSDVWRDRATRVLTGPQSNLAPAMPMPAPFIDRAIGHRLFDVDGRDFIDFALTMGPMIFGHGYAPWIDAVQDQMARCPSPLPGQFHSPLEVELAERMVEIIPAAELVKYCLSGTEAVQLVFRLARAYTSRPIVLRFDGHYHGWLDNVLGGELSHAPDTPPYPVDVPAGQAGGFSTTTAGRAQQAFSETYKIPWNDLAGLEAVLDRYGERIALVHMEAIMCNFGACPPRPGYLEGVRRLCDRHGILLCFDEVITGFRVALGGAQEVTGVTPDLCTYGKALAAGLPLAAVAGKREVMSLLTDRRVVGAGTFNCFPLALAAGCATIDLLRADDCAIFSQVDRIQGRLREAMVEMAHRHGHTLFLQGARGQIYVDFMDAEIAWSPDDFVGADIAKRSRFRVLALQNGLNIGAGSRIYISGTMSDDDLEEALARFECTFAQL